MISAPRELLEIGWGERVLTLEDFDVVAADKGIWVYKVRLRHDAGFHYYHRNTQPVIVLNNDLTPGDMAWKAHHELAHALIHPTGLYYFTKGTTEKADYEANFVASISLIPTPLFMSKTFEDIQEEYGYPNDLKWLRKEYYERYGK